MMACSSSVAYLAMQEATDVLPFPTMNCPLSETV